MTRDTSGRLRHPAGAPKSIGGQYAPDNSRGGAQAPAGNGEVAFTQYRSEIDGATVIELDTHDHQGSVRVNINDGTVYSADPESSAAPKFVPDPGATAIVIPARPVRLRTLSEPPTWPEELGEPEIVFGVDDSGRFHSIYSFDDGREVHMTQFEEGEDWSYTEDLEESHSIDLLDALTPEVKRVHRSLYTNAFRAGFSSCEEMPELREHIVKTTLNSPPGDSHTDPVEDYDVPAPERGALRAQRALQAYGARQDDPESSQTAVQDALTDLLHFADERDLNLHEVLARAQEMRDEERSNPLM